MSLTILNADCRVALKELSEGSVQCCVTSPPYFGLRDYGNAAQIGLEETPGAYIETMREVFREVFRVLKGDGVLFLVLGDSYSGSRKGGNPGHSPHVKQRSNAGSLSVRGIKRDGAKPKDLLGIPWRVAFALQADGWFLRSDIIWHKPNPMPESVTDRPTRSHETIFLFSKKARYYYDSEAISEPASQVSLERARYGWSGRTADTKGALTVGARTGSTFHKMAAGEVGMEAMVPQRVNKRSVWTVPAAQFNGAHFAVFPPDLIKPCILAGSRPGDIIFDPFAGSGTTGMVALELGRKAILIELNPDYCELCRQQCNVTPGLALV